MVNLAAGERRPAGPRSIPGRFPDWAEDRYPETLARLRGLLPDGHPRLWVYANRVLEDAECARAWKAAAAARPPVPDPYEAKRRADAEYLDSLEPQITAARAVANRLMRHDALRTEIALSNALRNAAVALGWAPPGPNDPDRAGKFPLGRWPWPARDVIAQTLRAYADFLERTPAARRGPWEHRFRVGPLRFTEPVDQHPARADLVTCLLFGATFWARWLSATCLPPPVGTPMPKGGRPLWPVAVSLVNEALGGKLGTKRGEKLDVKRAQNRLRLLSLRNPRVGWADWPIPPEPHFPPTLEARFPRS